MKKIYYLQKHEVKLGDVIEYAGIRTILTEELIELNPELFSIEEDSSMNLWAYIPSIKKEPFKLGTQPMYFKSLTGIKPFTTGRVYKQVDSIGYPSTIKLIADDNQEFTIYNWQSNYIHLNNNCFELTTKAEWDKQELIDEAKRRYPVGTVYKQFNTIYTTTSPDMLTVSEMDHHFFFGGSIWVKSGAYYGVVYTDGKWAEILHLKFTTEDGVDIYGDMKTYLVSPNDRSSDICSYHSIWAGNSNIHPNKYFYHKENALDYIKKHKEKTLNDYENILFERGNLITPSAGVVYCSMIYGWLKYNEPKLYYTKLLQLIADDLHGGRLTHIYMDTSYHIDNSYGVNVHCGHDEGCVYFKSRELAEKARVILGDKVKYLFNQA